MEFNIPTICRISDEELNKGFIDSRQNMLSKTNLKVNFLREFFFMCISVYLTKIYFQITQCHNFLCKLSNSAESKLLRDVPLAQRFVPWNMTRRVRISVEFVTFTYA